MDPRKLSSTHFLLFFLTLFLPEAASAAQLSAPTSFSATPVSSSQIDLRWTDSNLKLVQSTITGYSIERSLSATSGFALIDTTTKNATAYKDMGRASATTYYYRVRTLGRNGVVSPVSNVTSATTPTADTTAPSMPPGLTASAPSCSQVILSWTASSETGGSGLAGYKVFRNGVQIATTNVASYNSTGLAASASYTFTVSAYDNAGNASGVSTAA